MYRNYRLKEVYMKIKNRIIKLLGGYTSEEYDKLIMSYTNLRRRCAMK